MFDDLSWKAVALVALPLLIVVGLPVGCEVNNNRQIEAMVRTGVDPIEARCALGNWEGSKGAICAMRAARVK
jgi:hypothetical protein